MSEHKTKSEAQRLTDREKYQAAKAARAEEKAPKRQERREQIAQIRGHGRKNGW